MTSCVAFNLIRSNQGTSLKFAILAVLGQVLVVTEYGVLILFAQWHHGIVRVVQSDSQQPGHIHAIGGSNITVLLIGG